MFQNLAFVLLDYSVLILKLHFFLIQHLVIQFQKNTKHVRDAIELLKKENVDFDFDGEMQPDVALNPIYKETYPFSKKLLEMQIF